MADQNESKTRSSATTPSDDRPDISRRKLLLGGAAGVGVTAAAVGAVALLARSGVETTDTVVAKRVRGPVPSDDPEADAWSSAPTSHIEMDVQNIALPTKPQRSVDTVAVKALHDGETIAFRVEWKDDTADEEAIRVDSFRDACAVLLSSGVGNAAVRVMGTKDNPATILHWKADWQVDVDRGYQDVAAAFPNMTFDYYPPLARLDGPPRVPTSYEKANATQWLPGYHVENVVSRMVRKSPVEKARAVGFGTLTTLPTQDATGKGVHKDGRWRVVLAKRMKATDEDEITLEPGKEYAAAVAIWAGHQNDVGGHKSPSKLLLTLRLDP